MEFIWSCDSDYIEDNALTAAVKRLRYKLGADCIKTVYGLGYMWSVKKADPEER
jgi:DNA-binding response OmpR family regulator